MSDLDKYESQKGVTLMTLHSAKGLEFKIVFLAGMEEGILPHASSRDESDDVEEERRLCYVGMTRAREQLYCLHALERRLHGKFREQNPSPFLEEIPDEVKEPVRLARASTYSQSAPSWRERPMGAYSSNDRYGNERYGGGGSSYGRGASSGSSGSSYGRPTQSRPPVPQRAPAPPPKPAAPSRVEQSSNSVFSFFKDAPVQFDPAAIRPAAPPPSDAPKPAADLKRGQRVRHEQFGDGTILTMEGSGPDAKLTVYFDRVGSKKFIAKYAKLMRV
jgi:DNA helicase-2/ATP-dependent DNA helicase PcrA